jgi:DNA-binding NarL/FixJ family response regulator
VPIRVVLAEDSLIVREGVRRLLELDGEVEVVAGCGDLDALLEAVELGVVVLSQYAEPGFALALLEDGSDGRAYLLKDRVDDRAMLIGAIQTVARGGSYVDPKIVEVLVASRRANERSALAELTPRELDVLREMARGANNAAIAEALVVTERSVEKYVHSIFAKLGLTWEDNVNRRVKAVLLYLSEQG